MELTWETIEYIGTLWVGGLVWAPAFLIVTFKLAKKIVNKFPVEFNIEKDEKKEE